VLLAVSSFREFIYFLIQLALIIKYPQFTCFKYVIPCNINFHWVDSCCFICLCLATPIIIFYATTCPRSKSCQTTQRIFSFISPQAMKDGTFHLFSPFPNAVLFKVNVIIITIFYIAPIFGHSHWLHITFIFRSIRRISLYLKHQCAINFPHFMTQKPNLFSNQPMTSKDIDSKYSSLCIDD
jgi:hypothetical protein